MNLGSKPYSILPETGSHLRREEKIIMKKIPSQKGGIEMPRKDPPMLSLSSGEFCLTADHIPMGNPIARPNRSDPRASSIVAGNLSLINFQTGSFFLKDVPKSPLTSPER